MFDFLKNNPLAVAAKGARLRPRSMIFHLLIFFVVMTVTDIALSIPVSFYTTIAAMLSLPPELILAETPEAMEQLMQAMEEILPAIERGDGYLLVTLLAHLITLILVVIYCRFVERRPLSSMGLASVRHPFAHYGAGLFAGLAMFGLAFLVLLATGAVTVSVGSFSVPMLLLYLFAFLIYGAALEVMYHGYFMVSLTAVSRPGGAVVFSSLFFALLQVYVVGFSFLSFLNTFLFSALLGLLTFRLRSLYASMALRGVWYFAEMVLFGCVGSDAAPTHRVLSSVLTAGRDVTHGGLFGVENGAAVSAVRVIALGVLLLLPQKPAEKTEDAEEKTEEAM